MVISWDEYFMGLAHLSAMRSKDPNTQVGACIVDNDKKVVSIGYNGMPKGLDEKFPWEREGGFLDSKYAFVVHAELNAILNSPRTVKDCTVYVSLFPCNECAKAIIQAGIKEVIYAIPYDHDNHSEEMEASIRMFNECGVSYRKFEPTQRKEIVLELEG